MEVQIILAALQFILDMVPKITTSQNINQIITMLQGWMPVIKQEAAVLYPVFEQIMALIKGSATLTDDQVAAIDALIADADGDFDAAAGAAGV